MSTASKITLGVTSLSAIGIVVFVHSAQRWEREAMHAGVIRDMARQEQHHFIQEEERAQREQQQRVQNERLLDFKMQQALEQEYRKVQRVSDGAGEGKAG